jgi:hypothetical protein
VFRVLTTVNLLLSTPVHIHIYIYIYIYLFIYLRNRDILLINLQEVGGGRGDWMELAQDRDRWRALVGTVRDFRVP